MSKVLAVSMQPQEKNNWCWLAVAVSISQFYDSNSPWTQCNLANAELSLSNCCDQNCSLQCDVPGNLQAALTRTANLRTTIASAESYQNVVREIDANNPLAARIRWSSSAGHFVVIVGYRQLQLPDGSVDETIEVADPWYGSSIIPYEDFRLDYQSDGEWSHTYTTTS